MEFGEQNKLPIRKLANSIERQGIAYVRSIVENANCIFKEIDRASDFGHDAFVLMVDDEVVQPAEIAIQVKAGRSYCDDDFCYFQAKASQLNFWASHPLTTYGIVFDPFESCAWWVDLKSESKSRALSEANQGKLIRFSKEELTRFDDINFRELFLPLILSKLPRISLEKAMDWSSSANNELHDIGCLVLTKKYIDRWEVWEKIFQEFQSRGRNCSFYVFRSLILIMGHCDIGSYGAEFPANIKQEFVGRILSFGKNEVAELLGFVGDEGFDRGDVGYALFAIIPKLENAMWILREISSDQNQPQDIVFNASVMISIFENDEHWWGLWR